MRFLLGFLLTVALIVLPATRPWDTHNLVWFFGSAIAEGLLFSGLLFLIVETIWS